jgi:acyl-CoA thioesterase-1
MRIVAASLAIGSLVPLGCATTPTSSASLSPSASGMVIRYVAVGDSYTIGTSIAGVDAFPNQLVAAVNDKVPLQLVANLGVNGYSTADVLRAELPRLPVLQPDFVTLLIGVNDVVRNVPADKYQENLDQIFGAILSEVPTNRVVVVSIPDYTRTPTGSTFGGLQQSNAIAEFNRIMKAAADIRDIAFIDISSVADLAGGDPTLVARDGLHPSAVQYAGWVELIAPVVEGLFAK